MKPKHVEEEGMQPLLSSLFPSPYSHELEAEERFELGFPEPALQPLSPSIAVRRFQKRRFQDAPAPFPFAQPIDLMSFY